MIANIFTCIANIQHSCITNITIHAISLLNFHAFKKFSKYSPTKFDISYSKIIPTNKWQINVQFTQFHSKSRACCCYTAGILATYTNGNHGNLVCMVNVLWSLSKKTFELITKQELSCRVYSISCHFGTELALNDIIETDFWRILKADSELGTLVSYYKFN